MVLTEGTCTCSRLPVAFNYRKLKKKQFSLKVVGYQNFAFDYRKLYLKKNSFAYYQYNITLSWLFWLNFDVYVV